MRFLFFIGHDGFIRNFESVLEALAGRGHEIHLAVRGRRQALMSDAQSIDELCARHPGITSSRVAKAGDYPLTPVLEAIVRSRNYLRYLEPGYAGAHKLRARAEQFAPAPLPRLARGPLLRSPGVRHLLDAALLQTMRHLGTSPALDAYVREHDPDAALFTPLISFGLGQHSALRSATSLGVPTAVLVHSWDNLTNKGLIHELPDRLVVWNEAQRGEAVALHGIPAERVVVTGAHTYDRWFGREPGTTREAFCAELGLPPARPFLLYVGSSGFIAPDEARFVERWVRGLRASSDPRVRDVGLVLRPHPQNEDSWHGAELEEPGRTVVWPPLGSARAGSSARAEYFDSLFHCAAVVGINTSALIESAIVGRPVLTLLVPEYRETQEGTPHFAHLAGEAEGVLAVARTLAEHEEQIAGALEGDPDFAVRAGAFLGRFVRPYGLDSPGVPRVVEALEALGSLRPSAASPTRLRPVLEAALRPVAGASGRAGERERARLAGAEARGEGKGLRLLFFMRSINYDRHFEGALRELLARGHRVHVLLDVQKKGRAGDTSLFDELRAEYPSFSHGLAPPRRQGPWEGFGRGLRLGIDFLRYLEPEYERASALRQRARARAPRLVTSLARTRPGRSGAGRAALDRALRVLEAALPEQRAVQAFLESYEPDAVLVTPLVGLGSPQGDYVRAARRLGAPSALLVASWDNLTNKGVVRDAPDLTVVWNEAQRREAAVLHGIPRERVLVTGAHTYDHWFTWRPSTSREEFCAKVGLDPARPFLLYVCSSRFIAPDEAAFVGEWLGRLRAAEDPLLREVGVLVRPHPANAAMWQEVDLTEPGRTTVWPREGASPTSGERKADYFDSIHHCAAVVGINTSAQIESAIVGRPVLTVLAPEFRETQEGTLHFEYLLSEGGAGLLYAARTPGEHVEQLGAVLRERDGFAARSDRFVETFVRPHGRDVAAAPRLVAAVEELAARSLVPAARPFWHGPVRLLEAPLVYGGGSAARLLRRLSHARPARKPRPAARRRLLLVLDHPGLLIHFDETVRGLADRGNRVTLAFGRLDKFPGGLEALGDHPRIVVVGKVPARADRYRSLARGLRALADYVHYLDPGLAGARYSRAKWRELARIPAVLTTLRDRETLPRPLVRALLALESALEDAIPPDPRISSFVRKLEPDLVVVSPLVDARSGGTDYVKAARALGIPAALCVTSWDNLTSKGLIRIETDRVTVWNETQRREAVDLHGVAPERIVVTGAQPFDRWFGREPSSSRETFLRRVGLPPGRRFVLFVGSTKQNAAPGAEPMFVRRWVAALRESADERVRGLAVLVRPHPTNGEAWVDVELDDVTVWHPDRPLPVRPDDRADYFDSIFHCAAVVGINSSAMLEAAIVGRPVHTVALPEFRDLQRELLHFHYLLQENGGFLREASSFEEHARLLAADLADFGAGREQQLRFVESFVRPHGLDVAAAPRLMDAIEEAARLAPQTSAARKAARLAATPIVRGALLRGRVWSARERLRARLDRGREAAGRARNAGAGDGVVGRLEGLAVRSVERARSAVGGN